MGRNHVGYAAIALRGRVGANLRVVGNCATYYRYAVRVEGLPRSRRPLASSPMRWNWWRFEKNAIFPRIVPASVAIDQRDQIAAGNLVHLQLND